MTTKKMRNTCLGIGDHQNCTTHIWVIIIATDLCTRRALKIYKCKFIYLDDLLRDSHFLPCSRLGSPHCQAPRPLRRFLVESVLDTKSDFLRETSRLVLLPPHVVFSAVRRLCGRGPSVFRVDAKTVRCTRGTGNASHHVSRAVVVLDSSISSFVPVHVVCGSCDEERGSSGRWNRCVRWELPIT